VGSTNQLTVFFFMFLLATVLVLAPIHRYQMYKLCVIPSQVLLYKYWYQKSFSYTAIQALVVLLIGVSIATSPEFSTNTVGLGIGLLSAVVVVPLETVYNGETAKYYNWSSIQANQKTGWLRALLSWWMAYWMESTDVVGSWRNLEWGGATETNVGGGEGGGGGGGGGGQDGQQFLVCLFLSCVFAVFVNVASVAIIYRSTAVSYQVLGQSKTVGVVLVDLIKRSMCNVGGGTGGGGGGGALDSLKIIVGAFVALLGSWWYTKASKENDGKKKLVVAGEDSKKKL
jgi:hypothetical protein